MSINLQNGKTYVTSGGWVVKIFSISHSDKEYFFATQKTSPGTVNTKLVADWAKDYYVTWAKHCGWEYAANGTLKVGGAGDLMKKDLQIVYEYPYSLELPDGYKWAGGFPKVVETTADDFWLTIGGSVVKSSTIDIAPNIGTKRIRLEKISESGPQTQYYMTDTVDTNDIPTFYIYKNNKWFYKSKDVESDALATEDQIRSYIREGKYKSVTKEEFEKLLTSPMEKKVSPSSPSYPQYYIRTNGELYGGAVVVERTSEKYYKLLGKHGVTLLRDGNWWQAENFVKEKIWIEVSKQEANRLIAGGTPLLKYYARSNGARFSDGLVICRDWNDKCVTLDGKKTTPEYDWGTRNHYLYDGSWIEISRSKAIALLGNSEVKSPPEVVSVPSVPVKKEEEMSQNKLVSVITTGGSMVAKAINYLYVEPAKIIGGYVKRSLRYIVFTGTIAGIIYGANNPDALKKRIASVLPKITIEAPSVLK